MKINNFKPFGIIGMDDEGTFVYLPIRTATHIAGKSYIAGKNAGSKMPEISVEPVHTGSIEDPPTQEQIDLEEQKAEDYSVDGRLAKHKKREGKEE